MEIEQLKMQLEPEVRELMGEKRQLEVVISELIQIKDQLEKDVRDLAYINNGTTYDTHRPKVGNTAHKRQLEINKKN